MIKRTLTMKQWWRSRLLGRILLQITLNTWLEKSFLPVVSRALTSLIPNSLQNLPGETHRHTYTCIYVTDDRGWLLYMTWHLLFRLTHSKKGHLNCTVMWFRVRTDLSYVSEQHVIWLICFLLLWKNKYLFMTTAIWGSLFLPMWFTKLGGLDWCPPL